MEVRSTLRVIDQAKLAAQPGVTEGQTVKPLVGNPDQPTDRVRVALATYPRRSRNLTRVCSREVDPASARSF